MRKIIRRLSGVEAALDEELSLPSLRLRSVGGIMNAQWAELETLNVHRFLEN